MSAPPHEGRKADIARGRKGRPHSQKGEAIATYAPCGNAELAAIEHGGVDKVAAVEATDEKID